ncbi:MAG: hypothetical protein KDC52_10295, partial [Ignavibacteriae bacterium]|nr:hypothetical protein [Ignavibacteriota bacterium]
KVCTIVSILSPLTYWDRNIDLAEKSINQWINGEKVKVHIFKKNDRKVEKVLNFPSFIFDIDSFMNKNTGRKTYNFTYNLSQPTNPDYVTIDSFIISLACGLSEYSFSAKINNKGYDVIKKQLTILAEKYDIVPCEMQAILWSVSHRDNNSSYQDLISLVKEHDSEMVIEKYV